MDTNGYKPRMDTNRFADRAYLISQIPFRSPHSALRDFCLLVLLILGFAAGSVRANQVIADPIADYLSMNVPDRAENAGRLLVLKRVEVDMEGNGNPVVFVGTWYRMSGPTKSVFHWDSLISLDENSGAAIFLGGRRIRLAERLKKPTELFFVHANPGIRNRHPDHESIEALHAERQLAPMGKFARIAQHIEQALLDLGAVAANAADRIEGVDFERVAILGRQRRNDRAHLFK